MPIQNTVADQPTVQFVARACGSVTMQCNPGVFNGGAAITAYSFTYFETGVNGAQQRTVSISNLNNNNAQNSDWINRRTTITDITNGRQYTFYCQSQNSVGFSSASQTYDVNVGDAPGRPLNVRTDLDGSHTNAVVTWSPPSNTCGWPITGCTVAIQKTANQFVNGISQTVTSFNDATRYCSEVNSIAQGADPNVQRYVPGTFCTLPLTTLEANPFGIIDGESIFARIQCQNIIGLSPVSDIENGAINPSVPDQIQTLTCSAKTASTVTITW